MSNQFYTLIVVPHARARFRKFNVSVRLTKWVGGILGTVVVVVFGVLCHYGRIAVEVQQLRRLKAENLVLVARTQEYEQNATKLQAKLLNLQSMVKKLGVMAGLDQTLPDAALGGVGGAPSPEVVAPSMDQHMSLLNLDQDLSALTRRSQQLEEFYRDQKVVLSSTPSIWPVRGYLSTSFGNHIDPFTGEKDFHSGIDISTPIGARVQAPADGVVVSCEPKGGYGNAIIIDHQYGIVTRYAHLDRFNVRPGQKVKRGDVIGFVGNTGRSTGPHLHYEVWVHDQALNPIQFILDEYRSFG
jgi:murein DD-endopeptidase MepM/ murein hydrolase activator NlpD